MSRPDEALATPSVVRTKTGVAKPSPPDVERTTTLEGLLESREAVAPRGFFARFQFARLNTGRTTNPAFGFFRVPKYCVTWTTAVASENGAAPVTSAVKTPE